MLYQKAIVLTGLAIALGLVRVGAIGFPEVAVAQTVQERKAEGDRLLQEGNQWFQSRQPKAALQSWQQALKIYQDIKDRRSQGSALRRMGSAYSDLGNDARAIECNQQSLTIAREIKDRNEERKSLGSLGVNYLSLGDYAKAIEYHEQTLVIARELKDERAERTALNAIRGTYQAKQEALATKDRPKKGNAPSTSGVGSPREAQTIAQTVEAQRKEEAGRLISQGLEQLYLSQFEAANKSIQQALIIYRELKDRSEEQGVMQTFAQFYLVYGDFPRAIEYLEQSLPIARELRDQEAERITLVSLGNGYAGIGNYARAINYYEQSLAITPRDQGGYTLGGLGDVYYALGNYAKAIEYHDQSLAIALTLKDQQEAERGALESLAKDYQALGNYAKAIKYSQKLLEISSDKYLGGDRASAFSGFGQALQKQKQPELAIVFYKQAVNILESIRQELRESQQSELAQRYLTEGLRAFGQKAERSQTEGDRGIPYRNLADLLLQQNRVMEALQVLDLLKVQELQDFFKDVKGNERTAQGIEMLSEEQQILSHLDTANLNEHLKSGSVAALVKQLRQTAKAQNLKLAAYTDLQTRLQHLGTNSALLYPLILPDRIEVVLFTHNAPPIHRSTPIDQMKLEQTIQSFRAAIQQKDSQDIQQPANQLYNWLIQPIEADLKQANIKTLIYAPDGQMRYVPLAALYDGQHWLVEKYEINYVTALSLTKLDQRSSQPPRILAGAFTDSNSSVTIDGQHFVFGAIPFALPEVEDLNKQFPNATKLLTGKAFNRSAMTSDLINGYSIVHLATHGKLVSGAPEASFILLNNNEYITLRDIKDWKLPNVALVVLSACQTALGNKSGNGIEVIGFGYQLQQAQVRASIATLWEISDASTSDLMNGFYARLQTNQLSPVEALRQAQVAMIRAGGSVSKQTRDDSFKLPPQNGSNAAITRNLSHPYYWAPFILIGNGL